MTIHHDPATKVLINLAAGIVIVLAVSFSVFDSKNEKKPIRESRNRICATDLVMTQSGNRSFCAKSGCFSDRWQFEDIHFRSDVLSVRSDYAFSDFDCLAGEAWGNVKMLFGKEESSLVASSIGWNDDRWFAFGDLEVDVSSIRFRADNATGNMGEQILTLTSIKPMIPQENREGLEEK